MIYSWYNLCTFIFIFWCFLYFFSVLFRISISNSIFKLSTINTVSRRQISNVCAVRKSDWLHPRKIREKATRAFAHDALLPLVSIHDRRSSHRRLIPRRGWKRKKKNDDTWKSREGKYGAMHGHAASAKFRCMTARWALLIPCGRGPPLFFHEFVG